MQFLQNSSQFLKDFLNFWKGNFQQNITKFLKSWGIAFQEFLKRLITTNITSNVRFYIMLTTAAQLAFSLLIVFYELKMIIVIIILFLMGCINRKNHQIDLQFFWKEKSKKTEKLHNGSNCLNDELNNHSEFKNFHSFTVPEVINSFCTTFLMYFWIIH